MGSACCSSGQARETATLREVRAALENDDLVTLSGLLSSARVRRVVRSHKTELLQAAVRNHQTAILGAMRDVGLLPCDQRDVSNFAAVRWCPLLDAIRMGNSAWVDVLYEHQILGRTADFPPISCALKWATLKEIKQLDVEILNTLIKHGENVDEFYEHKTPIFYAAREKLWHSVEILLRHGAKVDTFCGDITARDLIQADHPELLAGVPPPDKKYFLLKALKTGDTERFTQLMEASPELCNMTDDQGFTILQRAIQRGCSKAVDVVLGQGADPNTADLAAKIHTSDFSSRSSPPIVMALIRGESYIFKRLVYHKNINLLHKYKGENTVYHLLARDWRYVRNDDIRSLALDCVKILFKFADSFELNIYKKNSKGNSALKLACKTRDKELLHLFFKYGAFADVEFDNLVCVPAADLQEYLDGCVIPRASNKCAPEEVELSFSFLDISHYQPRNSRFFEKTSHLNYYEMDSRESLFSSYTSLSLRDPAEERDATEQLSEMKLLSNISLSAAHEHLLKHPVIKTFLYMKWRRVCVIYLLNILLYLTFTVCFSFYVYDFVYHISFFNVLSSEPLKICVWGATFSLWLLLVIRDLFQLWFTRLEYLKSLENCLEILMLGVVGFMLLVGYYRETAAIATILTYGELTLMLSRNPYISTYVTIIIKVARNSFKLLLIFCPCLYAFAFSFFVIFRGDSAQQSNNGTFSTLSISLFRTLTMISGEFEVDGIQFEVSSVISRVLFLLFLMVVVIVFANVLNALAISDTQGIVDEAEQICCIKEVVLYTKLETMWNMFFNVDCIRQCTGDKYKMSISVCPLDQHSSGVGSHYKLLTHALAYSLGRRLINKFLFGFDNAVIGKQLISIQHKTAVDRKSGYRDESSVLHNIIDSKFTNLNKLLESKEKKDEESFRELSNEIHEIKRILSILCKEKMK